MVNFVHSTPNLHMIGKKVSFDSNCFKPDDFDKRHNNNNYKHFYLGESEKYLYVFNLT